MASECLNTVTRFCRISLHCDKHLNMPYPITEEITYMIVGGAKANYSEAQAGWEEKHQIWFKSAQRMLDLIWDYPEKFGFRKIEDESSNPQ